MTDENLEKSAPEEGNNSAKKVMEEAAGKTVMVTMRQLLEAGVHYGHQCRRWNPKMKKYIFGARNGIHIIDLQKTVKKMKRALAFIEKTGAEGRHMLFVGTKRQAQDLVAEEARRCKMYFINHRWLGGTMTNYPTIKQSIQRLKQLEKMASDGTYNKLTKKEALNLDRHRIKLERNLGGVKDMPGLPGAIFITDAHKEHIAIKEARKLRIPIVALIDTNADPEGIDYVIPGNDDSFKSLELFTKAAADAYIRGRAKFQRGGGKSGAAAAKTQEGTIYDKEGHSIKVIKKKKKDKEKVEKGEKVEKAETGVDTEK